MSFEVSAIIPVLGPQPLLQRAIDSVLANPEICELLVVDDGSKNPLVPAPHPRLKVIRHDVNKGQAAARNTGARSAVCDWLTFLDADDIWDANKTKIQIGALRRGGAGAIGAVCAFGFQRGGSHVVCKPPADRLEFDHGLAGARFGLGSTMVVSRSAFLQSGGYDESFARYEDWDWLLRTLRIGHFLTQRDELVTISHGHRANPSDALKALAKLAEGPLTRGLTPSQSSVFKAAIALERASVLLAGRRRLAAAWNILEAMRHRPDWVSRAIYDRLAGGEVPGT
jgi:glycosyltransferase involved in cell wall biosynthesis